MQAFHIPGEAPLYTNTFLLISDAGHAVVIDPAADAQTYDKILKEHHVPLTAILCTHGHYDHVGSAKALQASGTQSSTAKRPIWQVTGCIRFPLPTAAMRKGRASRWMS